MSLGRVTSIETFQHVRGASPGPAGSRDRKMSFNPVGEWVPPAAHEEPIAAFEVSKARRISQVVAAVIYCLLAAGIVFGYAAIKPVLVSEGVYRDLCTPKEIKDGVRTCFKQEIHLNLMFTVAAVATNVCALPVGTILDRYGPRVTGIIGSILIAVGCLLFGLAGLLHFEGYIPGYLFLALGGPFIFISSFQLSNTFPAHSGLILSMLTGAFDSSSAVFLIYRLIYDASHHRFTPSYFFLLYIIVALFIFIVQVTLMPAQSYKTVGELVTQAEEDETSDTDSLDSTSQRTRISGRSRPRRESVISEITQLLGPEAGDSATRAEAQKQESSGVWGALHGRTAAQQIRSPWFVLIALFTIVQMLRINYFVATIRPQYEYLLGSYEAAVRVNTFFDVALPVGGLVAVPLIGIVLDNFSTVFVLSLLVSIASTIGVLGVLPFEGAAYVNVVLFCIYRPFYYTAISDYSAKVFGFTTFGSVYGTIMCLGGLFNFLQTPLDAMTHGAFDGDPVPGNVLLLVVAAVIGIALVAFVWRRSKGLRREMLREEAEGARESLMPGATLDTTNGDVS
ncbi:MAG: hypothetical protein M1825_004055 [Sarcosagium campestre]|nr:MAG: hypothetical protein M1825_004055 [Sarcosagium campestre]